MICLALFHSSLPLFDPPEPVSLPPSLSHVSPSSSISSSSSSSSTSLQNPNSNLSEVSPSPTPGPNQPVSAVKRAKLIPSSSSSLSRESLSEAASSLSFSDETSEKTSPKNDRKKGGKNLKQAEKDQVKKRKNEKHRSRGQTGTLELVLHNIPINLIFSVFSFVNVVF